MINFIKDFDEIIADYIADLKAENSSFDTSEDSQFLKVGKPHAYIANSLFTGLQIVQSSNRISEAESSNLDKLGANYGMDRKPSEKATVRLNFAGINGTSIPIGTTVQTESDINTSPIVFKTVEVGTVQSLTDSTISFADTDPDTILDSNNGFLIAGLAVDDYIYVGGSANNDGIYQIDTVVAGVITLKAEYELTVEPASLDITISKIIASEASVGGIAGNVGADSLIVLNNAIAGVSAVTNPEQAEGGADKEADGPTFDIETEDPDDFVDTANYRGRILDKIRNNFGKTTTAGYRQTGLTVSGVIDVTIITQTTNPPEIYAYPVVGTGNGIPDVAKIAEIQAVYDLDENKDPLDTILVTAPTPDSIDVTYSLVIESGYDSAEVIANVESNLTDYLNGMGIDEDVLISELDNIVHDTAGVFNYTRTLPAADVTITAPDKAVAGTINIS